MNWFHKVFKSLHGVFKASKSKVVIILSLAFIIGLFYTFHMQMPTKKINNKKINKAKVYNIPGDIKITNEDEKIFTIKSRKTKTNVVAFNDENMSDPVSIRNRDDACKSLNISKEEYYRRLNNGISISYFPSNSIVPNNDFSFVDVDFTKLKKINNEVQGYIAISSINLETPILMHNEPNQPDQVSNFYLSHDINKNVSSGGCIFVDNRTGLDQSFNTIIYGHNMPDGTMFGSLKNLLSPEVQNKKDSDIIQLLTSNSKKRYQIVSVCILDASDLIYSNVDYDRYPTSVLTETINYLKDKNMVSKWGKIATEATDRYITLSTCYGPAGTTKRLVIFAKCI